VSDVQQIILTRLSCYLFCIL